MIFFRFAILDDLIIDVKPSCAFTRASLFYNLQIQQSKIKLYKMQNTITDIVLK